MAKLPGAVQGARIVGQRFVREQREQNPDGRMPLMDHIRELRNRVVKMALGLIAGMIVGFVFFNWAFKILEDPLCRAKVRGLTGCHTIGVNQLVLSGPLDSFYMRVKIAFLVGIIISCPIWLYQIWKFVSPGLYAKEKRWGYIFLGSAVPLFLLGIMLAYLSLTRTMQYMLHLTPIGVSNLIEFDQYFSFVITMLLAFGFGFELPLLIVMLNLAGILTHARFRKWRRVLIFVVFVVAGIANPSPDPITMLILGGACVALVEAAELIVWSNDRRRARLHPSPYAGLADDELSPIDLEDNDPDPDSRNSRFN
jgi:sec-independent protein translocase protein TatC